MLKKSLFTIVFILSIFCLGGCDYPSSDSTIYRKNVVINNSDFDVQLSSLDETFFVPSGITKDCYLRMNRKDTDFKYLFINDNTYPRVVMSKTISGYLTYEYTINNSTPNSFEIKNMSEYDVKVFDNYLGATYNKDGIVIPKGDSITVDFYSTPSITAIYSNNKEFPDGLSANVVSYNNSYIIN